MAKEILINVEDREKRIAIIENNKLVDFFIEHPEDRTIVGNIYKGKVCDIVPSVGAAFVDIGLEKNGFLYLTDAMEMLEEELELSAEAGQPKQPLQLTKGQEILVQVTKEPFSGKGARLTTHVSIPGRYLVLTPLDRHSGVSRKIDEQDERRRIREILNSINSRKEVGLIARTAAWVKDKKELQRDMQYLLHVWHRIDKVSGRCKAPTLLYEDYDLVMRTVRDYFTENVEKLIIDSKPEFKTVYRFVANFLRPLVRRVVFHREEMPLFEKKGVEIEVERIYSNKIYLDCGGYIIIEQTEGLLVVDVNSGSFAKKNLPQEEAAFLINSQAAQEIGRQLRLRDLSGIIVIDFIDMMQESNRRGLLKILKMALAADKAKTDVVGISRLGLVEMTRKRVHRSIESISYKTCPYCKGKGKIKSEVSMAADVLRKLRTTLSHNKNKSVTVLLHPTVAEKISRDHIRAIRNFERKFRKRIIVSGDASVHIEEIKLA